jgi:hypothetical protein
MIRSNFHSSGSAPPSTDLRIVTVGFEDEWPIDAASSGPPDATRLAGVVNAHALVIAGALTPDEFQTA